jgi:hypothetical protein
MKRRRIYIGGPCESNGHWLDDAGRAKTEHGYSPPSDLGRCSSFRSKEVEGAFPWRPFFHELCAGEQLQIFNPAICGQAKEFVMDKRAEMWRAALPKPARTY